MTHTHANIFNDHIINCLPSVFPLSFLFPWELETNKQWGYAENMMHISAERDNDHIIICVPSLFLFSFVFPRVIVTKKQIPDRDYPVIIIRWLIIIADYHYSIHSILQVYFVFFHLLWQMVRTKHAARDSLLFITIEYGLEQLNHNNSGWFRLSFFVCLFFTRIIERTNLLSDCFLAINVMALPKHILS